MEAVTEAFIHFEKYSHLFACVDAHTAGTQDVKTLNEKNLDGTKTGDSCTNMYAGIHSRANISSVFLPSGAHVTHPAHSRLLTEQGC